MPNHQPKPKRIASWSCLPKTGVVLVFGHRGEGKSALAWWLADEAHKQGRQVAAFALSDQAKTALPKWVRHVETHQEVAKLKPCLVVADEAAFKVHARRAQSEANVEWTRLVAISRHKGHLLLFVGQHARQLDVGLVADADLVVMKRPSLLHLRFARPELRPELEMAYERFAKARGDKRAWSFVVDYHTGRVGFLRNGLPRFWSDKLSKAFAVVELAPERKETKIRRVRCAS